MDPALNHLVLHDHRRYIGENFLNSFLIFSSREKSLSKHFYRRKISCIIPFRIIFELYISHAFMIACFSFSQKKSSKLRILIVNMVHSAGELCLNGKVSQPFRVRALLFRNIMVHSAGIEPATLGFEDRYSSS